MYGSAADVFVNADGFKIFQVQALETILQWQRLWLQLGQLVE